MMSYKRFTAVALAAAFGLAACSDGGKGRRRRRRFGQCPQNRRNHLQIR
uniref:Lipoprotein n=1 Tax=Conchiformibius kuhniae TaxID=211502 RepID=A0A8T9MUP1_9NEIS|nr:hypothetical protein LVJ77_00080 [Conchiformibius kuhniae]